MEQVASESDTEHLRGERQRRSVAGGEPSAAYATSWHQHGWRPVDPDDESGRLYQRAVRLAVPDPDVEEGASR